MTVDAALSFLHLQGSVSEQTLVAAFRKLVKVYHPDRNADRLAWSTEKMAQLNEAYTIARAHLQAKTAGGKRGGRRKPRPTAESKAAPRPSDSAEDSKRGARYAAVSEAVFDSILTYYSYGLENVHLRSEGTRRLRYRTALKRMKECVGSLAELAEMDGSRRGLTRNLYGFARAFLENMLLVRTFIPDGQARNHKAWGHFHRGSLLLDTAIKQTFFRDEFRLPSGPEGLSVSEHEFMTILTRLSDTVWLPETLVKLSLLEAFVRLAASLKNTRR